MILIFTNKEDTHPTPVIEKLREWDVPFFRFNTECLLTDYSFQWWCNDAGADFRLENIKNGDIFYGHDITAIWERRAESPRTQLFQFEEPEINKMILDEARGFLSFLRYSLKDVYSIGSITADRVAGSKMLQLLIAQKLGAIIPRTYFSNRKSPAHAFFKGTDSLSVKPINIDSFFLDGEHEYVFFSQKRSFHDVFSQSDAAFEHTASFIQEYIEKQYEIRITVCDNELIACRIDSQSQKEGEGKEDWRQGYEYGLKHDIIDVPDSIKTFCFKFLQRLDLRFGCFDFILTPSNDYVFLECNPNGQWYWIELETGADISGMIARHLANPSMQ